MLLYKLGFITVLLFSGWLSLADSISGHSTPLHAICNQYSDTLLDISNPKLVRETAINLSYEGYNNLEGPVWYDGALYYSNIGNRPNPASTVPFTNLTTIWRWEPGQEPQLWLSDEFAGSNGMALGPDGKLIVARHLDGSISAIDWHTKAIQPLATSFNDKRFNSPNDLTISNDGTIYFTDPDWNVPSGNTSPIQGNDNQHIYRISPQGEVIKTNATALVPELGNKPNGIILSHDESQLLIAGLEGLWSFERTTTGLSDPIKLMDTPIDGLGKDCAGNIYVTTTKTMASAEAQQVIAILDKDYQALGDIIIPGIQIVTNVAFGGVDRKTLYITSLTVEKNSAGTGPRMCRGEPCLPASIFSIKLNVPGYPY